MRWRWIGCVSLVCVLLAPLHTAEGQTKIIERAMEVKKVNGQLELSVMFSEIFTTQLRERLSSGFTNRILIGVQLISSKDGSSVAQGVAEYIIRYDIWEESYGVRELWAKTISEPYSFEKLMAQYRVMDGKMDYRNTHQISSLKNLIEICGSLHRLPLSWRSEPRPDMKLTAYVRVEINPISGEQMSKVKEYLAPAFVNWKKFQADAVLTYKSPNFTMR
jgi:hypothetical protein